MTDSLQAATQRQLIASLARRAQAQQGRTRVLLDARLQALQADYEARYTPPAVTAAEPAETSVPAADPLAELSRHLAAHASPPGSELKTLRHFRRLWSRLSAEQRLTQSLAQEPEVAGPINSHSLVLRAMKRMRELSPEYLERYVSYVDALLWLDEAGGGNPLQHRDVLGAVAPAKPRARASRKR